MKKISGRRLDNLFLVLKTIRRIVDEAHERAARALDDTANDRKLADELRDEPAATAAGPGPSRIEDILPVFELLVKSGPARFHALCVRLIDERAMLATVLESIHIALENVDIPPRRRNLGKSARDAPKV